MAWLMPWMLVAYCFASFSWHEPQSTVVSGFLWGLLSPSKPSWQSVQSSVRCTDFANEASLTKSGTIRPAFFVWSFSSRWHSRHAAREFGAGAAAGAGFPSTARKDPAASPTAPSHNTAPHRRMRIRCGRNGAITPGAMLTRVNPPSSYRQPRKPAPHPLTDHGHILLRPWAFFVMVRIKARSFLPSGSGFALPRVRAVRSIRDDDAVDEPLE